jgi:uracil-DNA glycosylase
MPEGPEVRTLVDQLQGGVGRRLVNLHFVSGRYVRHGPPEGFPAFSSTISKWEPDKGPSKSVDVIKEWACKGKFMYILLDDGRRAGKDTDFQRSIWVTLGMSGRFVSEAAHKLSNEHTRWYLELLDMDSKITTRIYYQDARNFGTLKCSLSRVALAEKLQSLGPDLLCERTTEEDFVNIVLAQRPQTNVCKFLMNQSKISGVGNYILAESLYRAGIDPFASLDELNELQQKTLFRELRATALESYDAQGLTREKGGQFRTIDGERGRFEFQLLCYGRVLCAKGHPVRKEVGPHGRTIWYTDCQLLMSRSDRTAAVEATGVALSVTKTESLFSAAKVGGDETLSKAASLVGKEPDDRAVSELLSVLLEPSWREALSKVTQSESFQSLAQFLHDERRGGEIIYPPREEIFSALNLTPFDKVKVVIVGQDPYHGPGQGHGLAFSVRVSVKPPPSLQNIFREAMDDVGIKKPKHGNLEHWSTQGVLLLNTVLTVRKGAAYSHAKKGWEEFTDSIIQSLSDERQGLVFLLWGTPAAIKAASVDGTLHTIIRTSHPSPLGATKTLSPFLGSQSFSRANKALAVSGQDPIDWNVV